MSKRKSWFVLFVPPATSLDGYHQAFSVALLTNNEREKASPFFALFVRLPTQVISVHTRTVNCVRYHPTEPTSLFSASQDRTVRRWDVRNAQNGSAQVFKTRDSVRRVEVNPYQPQQFAMALDNGAVQIWDMRHTAKPESSFQAHEGPVYGNAPPAAPCPSQRHRHLRCAGALGPSWGLTGRWGAPLAGIRWCGTPM